MRFFDESFIGMPDHYPLIAFVQEGFAIFETEHQRFMRLWENVSSQSLSRVGENGFCRCYRRHRFSK